MKNVLTKQHKHTYTNTQAEHTFQTAESTKLESLGA